MYQNYRFGGVSPLDSILYSVSVIVTVIPDPPRLPHVSSSR